MTSVNAAPDIEGRGKNEVLLRFHPKKKRRGNSPEAWRYNGPSGRAETCSVTTYSHLRHSTSTVPCWCRQSNLPLRLQCLTHFSGVPNTALVPFYSAFQVSLKRGRGWMVYHADELPWTSPRPDSGSHPSSPTVRSHRPCHRWCVKAPTFLPPLPSLVTHPVPQSTTQAGNLPAIFRVVSCRIGTIKQKKKVADTPGATWPWKGRTVKHSGSETQLQLPH